MIGASPLHRPIKTVLGALGSWDLLSPVDLASLGPFFVAGFAAYAIRPMWLDRFSVLDFARRLRVTDRAVRHLLVPTTAGIFFLPPERYSAFHYFGLFAPALPRVLQTRVGAFMGGMSDVLAQPIADAITAAGGQVHTACHVEGVIVRDGVATGVRTEDGTLEATDVVLAVELGAAQTLLRDAVGGHPWFEPMLSMPTTPSATIQIDLREPSMDVDRTTFGPGTVLASFAEQSRTTFRHARGRLSVILQPPEPYLDADPEEVLELVVEDAERLGLRIRDRVVRHRVVNHPYDFPSLEPGHAHQRGEQSTPVPGLTLAGDYTRQRWLATMEGAVLSGRLAAQAVTEARA